MKLAEARCDFCEAGQPDDDGGDKEHDDGCPLYGYDHTRDRGAGGDP